MANRQYTLAERGERNQLLSLVKVRGDGFFAQDMSAGGQKRPHNFCMRTGGRTDADQFNLAQKLSPIRDRRDREVGREIAAGFGARIGNRRELYPWETLILS